VTDLADIQLKVYGELCTSYRAIDDFRAKLLSLLPLVSGSGMFLLLNETLPNPGKHAFSLPLLAIGTFGLTITLGLFVYEIYGIRKCDALIDAGRCLERSLGIEDGQFRRRPRSVLHIINEPLAAGVIYPAVLAAWLFLALSSQKPSQTLFGVNAPLIAAIIVFVVGFGLVLTYNIVLGNREPKKLYECVIGEKANETTSDCPAKPGGL
jgi:hypothetical protein